ncbi:MAG: SUMF1/EgtB/PvdO family nonheme iron enzyme [Bryobacteraceae bacterium]
MMADRLADARNRTDALFQILEPSAIYDRPVAERHRILFYLGHLEAFDGNLLRGGPHSEFDQLFAFGIDPVGTGLPTDQPGDWPSIEQIRNYNRETRAAVDQTPADELLWNVAIEHRLMHAETLAYLLHQMPLEKKIPQRQAVVTGREAKPGMVAVPAGSVVLGRSEGFGWDNEFDAHAVEVGAFEIDRYKVTNGDYLKFVREGGSPPVFWKDEHTYRTMFEEIPMPLDWPVYVSHSQASAYARWVGKSLPTEAEWQLAAQGSLPGNAGFQRWDPVPVTADPGMVGNGWEWTSTLFRPFPGFKAFPFYAGYSASFFDDQHYVMKGGSARTAECLLRPSFRNWFQPNYQYVYCGFRCVTR